MRPKRSSNCGRRSPSSRFIVPISVKRAGCETDRPSRWTELTPIAATSSSTSTSCSGKRLTSSMYRMPRCAVASRPGCKALFSPFKARCRSSVPSTRSSVAPSGKVTKGTVAETVLASPWQTAHCSAGCPGRQLKAQPATRSMGGNTAVNARAAVLLAVPLSPRIRTPPSVVSTAHSSKAFFSCGWPTMAENGNNGGKRGTLISDSARGFATRLQQGFTLEIKLAQVFQRLCLRFGPHAAACRFQQAFGDGVLRPGIGFFEEALHTGIEGVGLRQLFVHPVVHDLRRGVVAEQIIDRRRQLQPTLVTMALDAVEPLRIDDARAEHAQGFLLQIADLRARRVMAVAEIMARLLAGQRANGRNHAAVILQVIVAVEDVVFAVVLVMQGHLHARQTSAEGVALVAALLVAQLARIGVAAPVDVSLGKIGIGLPVLFLNQGQDAGTVAARLGAEDAIGGTLLCFVFVQALADPFAQLLQIMLAYEILIERLIQCDDGIDGVVDQIDQLREGVAEESADARSDVDARALQLLQRYHFDAGDLAIARTPHRTNAEQAQNLRHVVAVRAHGAGAPDADGDALRIRAGFAQMALQHFACQLLADAPCRLRRHAARIDRIEIAAGRQDMRHAACRRAAWAGRHVTSCETEQEIANLVTGAMQVGQELAAGEIEDAAQRCEFIS